MAGPTVPGLMRWTADLPDETSRALAASVDALAQEYLTADGHRRAGDPGAGGPGPGGSGPGGPRLTVEAARADALVDLAIAHPSFTVKRACAVLGLSYQRVNKLVGQLVELGVLRVLQDSSHGRRFYSPQVLRSLTSGGSPEAGSRRSDDNRPDPN